MRKEITAGWLLAKSRSDKKITLREVIENTYLSEDAIVALEKNNFNYFSSRLNAEGAAKKYAMYLSQDEEYIASLVRRDYLIIYPDLFPPYNIYSPKQTKKFDVWWWSGIGIVFLAILFFGYQIFLYLLPPKVHINEPNAKSFKRVEKIGVKGVVDRESEVFVNGKEANVENNGTFFIDIQLIRGKNNIQIRVVGANGRTTNKILEILNE